MGNRWKRWYASASVEPEIDLLSTAFGVPSRRELERASQTLTPRRVFRCDSDSDESSDDAQSEASDKSSDQSPSDGRVRKSNTSEDDQSLKATPSPASRKRQQTHGNGSTSKSQRSTLSKKIKRSRNSNRKIDDQQRQSPSKVSRAKSVPPSKSSRTSIGSQPDPKSSPPHVVNGHEPSAHHTTLNSASYPLFSLAQPQIPMLTAQYAPAYVFPPNPDPAIVTAKCQDALRPLRRPKFQRLHSLQGDLTRLQQELTEDPRNINLQKEVQQTQCELNDLLNSIVAQKVQTSGKASPTSKTLPKDTSNGSDLAANKENEAPLKSQQYAEARPPSVPKDNKDRSLLIAHRRGNSLSCTIRHHLCSGCGTVRSHTFHEKHPIRETHKPVLNFCSACRESRVEKGVMDKYHFCFGCGKVRSKSFQKKHECESGQPLLPNYCAQCASDVRKKEVMNDMSVLGIATSDIVLRAEQTGVKESKSPAPTTDGNQQNLASSKPRLQGKASVTLSCSGNAARLRLDNASLSKSVSAPVSPAESSPFYPGRKLGSAHRRAQRVPTPHCNEEPREGSNASAIQGEYRAPYVEEANSPTEQKMSASCCSSMASLGNRRMKTWHDDNGSYLEVMDCNDASCQTPDVGYKRTMVLQSTNSSGGKTVRCCPPSTNHDQQARMARSNKSQRKAKDPPSAASSREQSGFSKGVFGKHTKLETHDQAQTYRRRSPLADFEHSDAAFANEIGQRPESDAEAAEPLEALPFRSSRGAFGRNHSPTQARFSVFNYSQTDSDGSESKNANLPGVWPTPGPSTEAVDCHDTDEYSHLAKPNSAASSFSSDSNCGQTTNNFKADAPNEGTYSRSVFTDYSRSTNNPYYKPRHRPGYNGTNSDFCSTWDWKSKVRQGTKSPRAYRHQFDDRMPEPIVEEPVSPASSPVQRTKLLEFYITDPESSCESDTEYPGSSAGRLISNLAVHF